MKPWKLNYWKTGEWQVVEEHLRDLDKAGIEYCPSKKNLFKALEILPKEAVKVVILGQDPYPDPKYATGVALSIPDGLSFPPTLSTILREYSSDLNLPTPTSGNLTSWVEQGVLLWNVFPSCEAGKSMSHAWEEWSPLTQEILENVEGNRVVLAALGSVGASYLKYASKETPQIITSHPSPRGQMNAKNPFTGSRLFSRINEHLIQLGHTPIDWRLPDVSDHRPLFGHATPGPSGQDLRR